MVMLSRDEMTKFGSLVVPGDPVPKGRPKARIQGKRASLYTPKRTRDAEKAFAQYVRDRRLAPSEPLDLKFYVHIEFFTKTARRNDVDNLAKLVLDSCNGVIWTDDYLVEQLTLRVHRRDTQPRTQLSIWTFDA